jgi:hypothetical protein
MPDYEEIEPAWDPCVKCGECAPLDIHGVCIACELPEQFGRTYRDMTIEGGNLPDSPPRDSVPLSAVRGEIIETVRELQGFLNDLLASLDGSPAAFTLGDHAGDIRGNACHLWNLLVAVNDNKGGN